MSNCAENALPLLTSLSCFMQLICNFCMLKTLSPRSCGSLLFPLSCVFLLIPLALVLVLQGLTSPPCTVFIVFNSHCSSFLLSLSFYHSHSRPSEVLPQPVSLKGFSLLKRSFFLLLLPQDYKHSVCNPVKICEISYFHYLSQYD